MGKVATKQDGFDTDIDLDIRQQLTALFCHSEASGSGNYFRESFTAVLESTLQNAMTSIGIRFTALNYAMKFMSSGDEVAYCQQAIYPDSDIMFWDFAMTDEKDYWKLAMFGRRLAIHSTTALVAFQRTKGHAKVLAGLEEQGMTVLGKDWRVHQIQQSSFPDTVGLSAADLQALPPLLQYIRCGNEIEDGGPPIMSRGILRKLCRAHKFNMTVCPDRPHKYIWHPSYRTNAIKGHTLAMTLLEIMEDATQLLSDNSASIQQLRQEIDELQQAQRRDYERAKTASTVLGLGKWWEEEDERHGEIGLISFFQEPTLCRTALLPSNSRNVYQVQGTGMKITTLYNNTYERGTMLAKLRKEDLKAKNGFKNPEKEREQEMVLATEKSGYFECKDEVLSIDHQDAFLVTSKMGWKSLTLPNERERELFDTTKAKGYVFICLSVCDNSKCPDEDLHDRVYNKRVRMDQGDPIMMIAEYGKVEMELNGIRVMDYTPIIDNKVSHLDNCLALKKDSEKSPHTWQPNEDGAYQLKARIVDGTEWAYVKISSVIIM